MPWPKLCGCGTDAKGKEALFEERKELLDERKALRQQLEDKHKEHVASLEQASERQEQLAGNVQSLNLELRQTTQSLEEERRRREEEERQKEAARHQAQEARTEVHGLKARFQEVSVTCEAEKRAREDAEKKVAAGQAYAAEAEQTKRVLQQRLDQAEDLLKKEKERTRQLETDLRGAEQSAEAAEEKAANAEKLGRAEGAAELAELKQKYAEVTAAKDKELQVALLELQALSQGQELLRTELRHSLRPLPAPLRPILSPLRPARLQPPPRIPAVPWCGEFKKSPDKLADAIFTFGKDAADPWLMPPSEPIAQRKFVASSESRAQSEPMAQRQFVAARTRG
mmetsp:Transcript_55790/g.104653  ORF Transcript_55790/g.104653 Transcript_55790/m.104653 type:complete len:341 (+) Transcript_55790:34-1056(+)